MVWNSEILASITNGKAFSKWQSGKVVFDSRLVEEGDTFLALPGAALDGHDYVAQALEKGAAAAIVSKIPEGIVDISNLLIVENVLDALTIMAKYKRNKSKAKFIGVTGSLGKTSTKEILGLCLQVYGKTFISRGNYNNFLGVPINLASMPDDSEYAIIEIGMDQAGEITPLTSLSKPHMTIITAIENIHRANFDSIEGIARAKAEIFIGLEPAGAVIINSLSNCYELLLQIAQNNLNVSKVISIGLDSYLKSYLVQDNTTDAKVNILGQELNLKFIDIVSSHQIHNMIVALSCIKELNLDPSQSLECLKEFKLPRGRGLVSKIKVDEKNVTLIDDSYNAGPVSIKAALKNMSNYQGRKIALLGDMVDLGPESVSLHTGLKEDIINNNIDKVICFGKQMKDLYEVLPEDKKLGHYLTLKDLAAELPSKLLDGDILLIKGSFYLTNLYKFTKHLSEGTLHAL